MNVAIITGGSRGIGKALVEKYSSEGYKVFSLSRSIIDMQNVTQIPVDLSDLKATKDNFSMLLDELKKNNFSSLTLINNAGRLGTMANLEELSHEDIAKSIQLNTTTPLVLSSMFIKFASQFNCEKQIINISSGAGINAYQGWSVYCTSKASIDMLTKAIAVEQQQCNNGVKAFGIRPGVVDTEMQQEIRETNASNFVNKERFVALKNNNQLFSTNYVATKIFDLVTHKKIANGETIDIRNL